LVNRDLELLEILANIRKLEIKFGIRSEVRGPVRRGMRAARLHRGAQLLGICDKGSACISVPLVDYLKKVPVACYLPEREGEKKSENRKNLKFKIAKNQKIRKI